MTPQEAMCDNTTVLANAVEASAKILQNLMGNTMSNTVDGQMVDDSYLKTAVASKMNTKLIPYLQG